MQEMRDRESWSARRRGETEKDGAHAGRSLERAHSVSLIREDLQALAKKRQDAGDVHIYGNRRDQANSDVLSRPGLQLDEGALARFQRARSFKEDTGVQNANCPSLGSESLIYPRAGRAELYAKQEPATSKTTASSESSARMKDSAIDPTSVFSRQFSSADAFIPEKVWLSYGRCITLLVVCKVESLTKITSTRLCADSQTKTRYGVKGCWTSASLRAREYFGLPDG